MFNASYLLTLLFDNSRELSVQQRILETPNRSIAIANISSIELDRFPRWPLILLFLIPGVLSLLSTLFTLVGMMGMGGFNSSQSLSLTLGALPGLLISLGLMALYFFFDRRRKTYLVVSSNDGSSTVFRSGDLGFLQGVKEAIDDKINNDRIDTTFYANFADGSVQNLSIERIEANSLSAETVVTNSPGSVVANHAPGAQLGTGHNMQDTIFTRDYRPEAERVDKTGEKPWYEKMMDVPLEKTSDFLAGLSGSARNADDNSEISIPSKDQPGGPFNGTPLNGSVSEGFLHEPQSPDGGMLPLHDRGAGHPATRYPAPPFSSASFGLEGNPAEAQNYDAPTGNGPMVAQHSPAAQVGNNHHMNGVTVITDYRQHIPKIETIRRELTDPKVTEKLDEMIALMKAGTPQPQDKHRLKDYAVELATYVQAYPPITKIFNDIAQAVGV